MPQRRPTCRCTVAANLAAHALTDAVYPQYENWKMRQKGPWLLICSRYPVVPRTVMPGTACFSHLACTGVHSSSAASARMRLACRRLLLCIALAHPAHTRGHGQQTLMIIGAGMDECRALGMHTSELRQGLRRGLGQKTVTRCAMNIVTHLAHAMDYSSGDCSLLTEMYRRVSIDDAVPGGDQRADGPQ